MNDETRAAAPAVGQGDGAWDRRWKAYGEFLKKYPNAKDTWNSFFSGAEAEARAAIPQTPDVEKLAEQLHIWYLEACRELKPESFNPNAQKSYADLMEEQKFLDRYIARKVTEAIPQMGTQDERAEFESAARKKPNFNLYSLQQILPGVYADPLVQAAWEGWQYQGERTQELKKQLQVAHSVLREFGRHCELDNKMCKICLEFEADQALRPNQRRSSR